MTDIRQARIVFVTVSSEDSAGSFLNSRKRKLPPKKELTL